MVFPKLGNGEWEIGNLGNLPKILGLKPRRSTATVAQVSVTKETIGVMLKTFAVASLFWIAYQLTQGIPWTLFGSENIFKVIYVGIAGNLLPYLLFFWCIQRVQAERAAIAATLEPFVDRERQIQLDSL
jgi:hypothetical protein